MSYVRNIDKNRYGTFQTKASQSNGFFPSSNGGYNGWSNLSGSEMYSTAKTKAEEGLPIFLMGVGLAVGMIGTHFIIKKIA
jgi:hypothetical protein